MVPPRLGGPGAGFADYAEVAMALGAGAGATALVFNMHASVTGALAQTPDDVARALGVPESYFAMRDRGAAPGRGRGAVRGGDERARRRQPAVQADHARTSRPRTAST